MLAADDEEPEMHRHSFSQEEYTHPQSQDWDSCVREGKGNPQGSTSGFCCALNVVPQIRRRNSCLSL